ncbi:hypothetical protein CspeluHIS016_0501120 [Cutaneotrichosporon spelunceum]|uniref:Uncharacterized protein n=1 Tax=Cutaneotrichosporon spelunceum TaxID=1672016 RepID=A0AAD3TW81_9TREE|nr:hypothetical protein CspeluHIS016_0501120 [Cutaneotrichosporon spelunceum]
MGENRTRLGTDLIPGPEPSMRTPAHSTDAVSPRSRPVTLALDHMAYPQIMDAIFASSSPGALIVLRATCTAYRTRANVILNRHLALSDTSLRSALGPCVPVPVLRPEVLDCFAHWSLHPGPHVYAAAGTPTLRMRDGPLSVIDIIAPATVIVFGWERIEREKRWVMVGSAPSASPVEHCTTVRKVVVVIDGVPDYTCYARGMVRAWPSIRDITVIYVPKPPLRAAGSAVTLDSKVGRILYEMRGHVEVQEVGLRLTFVNADAMPPDAFPDAGLVDCWARDMVKSGPSKCDEWNWGPRERTLRDYVAVARKAHGPVVDEVVRFLSLDEYEHELGPEAFALETDPEFVLGQPDVGI